jgi:UrcA family protein
MKLGQPLALSVSLVFTSLAAPALAEPAAPMSVAVRYGDLDLSRPDAVAALYARIRAASRRVCAAAEGPGAARQAEWNACRREALDRAVASLGSEDVARVHAARSGHGGRVRAS